MADDWTKELWADYPSMTPPPGLEVVVELDDGQLSDAMFRENYYRAGFLFRAKDGLYWNTMFRKGGLVKRWRPRIPSDPVRHYEDLKDIKNDDANPRP